MPFRSLFVKQGNTCFTPFVRKKMNKRYNLPHIHDICLTFHHYLDRF
jgi:hypothetical protein